MGVCVDMHEDMYVDIVPRFVHWTWLTCVQACGKTRRVHRHMHRHVYRHVYRHACLGMDVVEMYMDMCIKQAYRYVQRCGYVRQGIRVDVFG